MIPEPSIIVLLFNVIIALVLLGFTFSYLQYFKTKEKELEEKSKQLLISPASEDIILDAHASADKLVEKAAEDAQAIIANTKVLERQIKEDVASIYKKMVRNNSEDTNEQAKKITKSYTQALQLVKQEYVKQMNEHLTKLRSATEKEVTDFVDIVRRETIDAQQYVGRKINTEYEAIEKELEAYRKQRLDKIDVSIKTILLKVSEEVLGKSISLADHEKLVLESLRQAKQEALFEL